MQSRLTLSVCSVARTDGSLLLSHAASMRVDFLDFVAGARAARGVAVIIDVFRACSVACYAIAEGAERIIPVAGIEEALELKRQNPEFIALGERGGRKLAGFDSGNSPIELQELDLRDKTVVHTTHSGTQGLVSVELAEVVITGSFVNAGAICRYLSALAPEQISLVRMGVEATDRSEADDLCAKLLAARLLAHTFDETSIRKQLRQSPEADKFFDPEVAWAPQRDFELCTALDRFDFVLRLGASSGGRRCLMPVFP